MEFGHGCPGALLYVPRIEVAVALDDRTASECRVARRAVRQDARELQHLRPGRATISRAGHRPVVVDAVRTRSVPVASGVTFQGRTPTALHPVTFVHVRAWSVERQSSGASSTGYPRAFRPGRPRAARRTGSGHDCGAARGAGRVAAEQQRHGQRAQDEHRDVREPEDRPHGRAAAAARRRSSRRGLGPGSPRLPQPTHRCSPSPPPRDAAAAAARPVPWTQPYALAADLTRPVGVSVDLGSDLGMIHRGWCRGWIAAIGRPHDHPSRPLSTDGGSAGGGSADIRRRLVGAAPLAGAVTAVAEVIPEHPERDHADEDQADDQHRR